MIDIKKVKEAFAATPTFCQGDFYKAPEGISPAALCAVSALVSHAGMSPQLIGQFCESLVDFANFANPVLEVAYGIPEEVGDDIPRVFDDAENEWGGVVQVIEMFEAYNVQEAKREAESLAAMSAAFGKQSVTQYLGNASWSIVKSPAVSSYTISAV